VKVAQAIEQVGDGLRVEMGEELDDQTDNDEARSNTHADNARDNGWHHKTDSR